MSGWTEEMRKDAETVRARLQVGPANRIELTKLVGNDMIRMSYAVGLLREEDAIEADPPLGTREADRPRRYFLKGGIAHFPILLKPDGSRTAIALEDVGAAVQDAPASVKLPGVESLVLVVTDNFLVLALEPNEEASRLAKTVILGNAVLVTRAQWSKR